VATMCGTIAALWVGTAILTVLVLAGAVADPASRWRSGSVADLLVGLALAR